MPRAVFVRFLLVSLSSVLLGACGSAGIKQERSISHTACVEPRSGEFAIAAHYWSETGAPRSEGSGSYGDLVVTDNAVRCVLCDTVALDLQRSLHKLPSFD